MGSCKILEYRRERFISDDAAGITAGEKRRDFQAIDQIKRTQANIEK